MRSSDVFVSLEITQIAQANALNADLISWDRELWNVFRIFSVFCEYLQNYSCGKIYIKH